MTEQPIVGALPDFSRFYDAEFRLVAGLAFVLSGNAAAAEELAQEAFAEAYRRWDEVGRMDYPGAWVRRVVSNRSVSRYRRLRAEMRALARLAGDRRTDVDLSDGSVEVVEAVRRLSDRQAQAVALYYFSDLPLDEVADAMDCSVETVRTHLQRGRARLGRMLGEAL